MNLKPGGAIELSVLAKSPHHQVDDSPIQLDSHDALKSEMMRREHVAPAPDADYRRRTTSAKSRRERAHILRKKSHLAGIATVAIHRCPGIVINIEPHQVRHRLRRIRARAPRECTLRDISIDGDKRANPGNRIPNLGRQTIALLKFPLAPKRLEPRCRRRVDHRDYRQRHPGADETKCTLSSTLSRIVSQPPR